jgi:hypothetical protein
MPREITIRRSSERDGAVLATLAALDSQTSPQGDALLAIVDGEAWAALPLGGGPALADPFRPSGQLVDLLRTASAMAAAR